MLPTLVSIELEEVFNVDAGRETAPGAVEATGAHFECRFDGREGGTVVRMPGGPGVDKELLGCAKCDDFTLPFIENVPDSLEEWNKLV